MTPFIHEYFQMGNETVVFKGNNLNSTTQQVKKVQEQAMNKEIRLIKRQHTIADKKEATTDQKNARLSLELTVHEENFQLDRARRISELFEERD